MYRLKLILPLLAAVILTLAAATSVIVTRGQVLPLSWRYATQIRAGQSIADKLRLYHAAHNTWPDTANHALMKSLGFELRAGWHPEPVFLTNGQFMLLFYMGFDGPNLRYSSAGHAWEEF